MSGISLKSITKQFGDLTAVDAVTFDVADDEVLCLLGPSGCGKTTTLRMIAGLENATDGEIYLSGQDMTHLPARARNVAMAFQFYALYPNLTVSDNLAYPLHAEGDSTADIAAKLRDIAQVLQMDHVLGRFPHQLSEGEKQRVAVGRCIIRRPNCFLFDEPLSRLDVQLREEMRSDIKKVLSGLSRPTVIVTHDQLEAMTMGDRIAVMRDGKVEQIGAPQDVFNNPANIFVAGFIGTPQMNLVSGIVSGIGGAIAVSIGQDVIELTGELAQPGHGLKLGDAVTLGMRPRSASLESESGQGILSGTCELIEPMGAETLLRIAHPAGQIRAIVTDRQGLKEGGTIHVRFAQGSYRLFHADGNRIGDMV